MQRDGPGALADGGKTTNLVRAPHLPHKTRKTKLKSLKWRSRLSNRTVREQGTFLDMISSWDLLMRRRLQPIRRIRVRVRGASQFGMFGIRLFSVALSCCTGAHRTFRETCAGSSRRERRSAPRTKLRSSISGSRARILRACHGLLALTCLMRLLRIALPNNFLAWRSRRTSGVAA